MKGITLIVVVFLFPFSVFGENHDLFSIRIVHPRNQEFIYSNLTPEYTEMWELHIMPGTDPKEKIWVSTQPTSMSLQDIREAKLIFYEADETFENDDLTRNLRTSYHLVVDKFFEEGYPMILIEFTEKGAEKFKILTQNHVKERLAIFLDGKLRTAPLVYEPISSGKAIIDADFSIEDAKELVNKINSAIKKNNPKIIQPPSAN